jgi:hypothetical protein
MSELSVKEQEVLDFLINFIETEIFIIEEEEREKGRLDYSLCFNDDEKLIMTKKKIKKFKSRIHDCNPVVAGYLNVLTSPYPSKYGYDELKQKITTNFIFSDYSELFEDLAKEDITDLENYQFKSVVKSMGYKYKNLKDFIQGICDVNSFLGYKSILEISNDPFTSSETNQHVVQDAEAIVYKNTTVALEQIDRKLWNWLQEFEKTNYYIETPSTIEERKDWITDTYLEYEERSFKYNIEICDAILKKVSKDEVIINFKKEYENKIHELRRINPIPAVSIEIIISDINNAFYRLEKFMQGSILEYKSFLFNDAFTLFFNELNKFENINYQYDNIKSGYFKLITIIGFDYDKSEFNNTDAYDNDDFNRDCNEIIYLAYDRYEEFNFQEEEQRIKISITDLIKPITYIPKAINIELEDKSSPLVEEQNPYPKIFKNHRAFTIFKDLQAEFGNTRENLSNYSFVFYKMTYEDLIHYDLKQQSYFNFLAEFDIIISRLKSLSAIGNKTFRESIYAKAKT